MPGLLRAAVRYVTWEQTTNRVRKWQPSPAYLRGYLPYLIALEQANLGPTWPKRDPRNMDKVKRANQVLIAEKWKRTPIGTPR